MATTPRTMQLLLRLYFPYIAAGIRVTHISPDWKKLHVEMKLRWYNRNLVHTQFGGNLYSMIDPHYMLLLMQLLGPEYTVWDKAAEIEFVRPGTGTVSATIRIFDHDLAAIRENTAGGQKYLPEFNLTIHGEDGTIVAKVKKTLYVRRKTA